MVRGTTDEEGIAVFTVEEGNYLVTASKIGFETSQVEISISQDMTLEITLAPISRESLISPIIFTGIGLILVSLA